MKIAESFKDLESLFFPLGQLCHQQCLFWVTCCNASHFEFLSLRSKWAQSFNYAGRGAEEPNLGSQGWGAAFGLFPLLPHTFPPGSGQKCRSWGANWISWGFSNVQIPPSFSSLCMALEPSMRKQEAPHFHAACWGTTSDPRIPRPHLGGISGLLGRGSLPLCLGLAELQQLSNSWSWGHLLWLMKSEKQTH